PARVGAGIRLDSLHARLPENRVGTTPAEDLVREHVKVLVYAEAAPPEELVESHPVRAIGLAGEQMLLHRLCQPARGGAVLRLDDVVGDEGGVEGDDRVPATGQGVVTETQAVLDAPGRQGKYRCGGEGGHVAGALPPGRAHDEREDDEDQ